MGCRLRCLSTLRHKLELLNVGVITPKGLIWYFEKGKFFEKKKKSLLWLTVEGYQRLSRGATNSKNFILLHYHQAFYDVIV